MTRLILAIVAFVLAIAVLKMVILAVVVAGLVFRTKQTIALLLFGGVLALLAAQPVLGTALLGAIVVFALVKRSKEKAAAAPPLAIEHHPGEPGQQ